MHQLKMHHTSSLPIEQLFAALEDHNNLRNVFGVPVQRIRDGQDNANGVGSVRKLGVAPILIEETVTRVEPGSMIEYRITKGGFPLKNHRGELQFTKRDDGGSEVEWHIEFDSSVPVLGSLVGQLLKTAISRGLRGVG